MKCTIPEISWHNRDPVLSVDFQPKVDEFLRLASGGTDSHVLIWYVTINESGSASVKVVSDLTRHQKAVNVVRWSPCGLYLASGDTESNIIIWKRKTEIDCLELDQRSEDEESWIAYRILRGHTDDVIDVSWSPDSTQLISGSVDNSAIIWNISKGSKEILRAEHDGFVQGVAWDPLNRYCATLCGDRVCRVFDVTTKTTVSRSVKRKQRTTDGRSTRLFHDDTHKSFYRRLVFSPDGRLLVAPSGLLEGDADATHIYARPRFDLPAISLPSPDGSTVAVRFCPARFELRPDGPQPAIALRSRYIFAVAAGSSIAFYDTQQIRPFAVVSQIHYMRLNDLAWTEDGRALVVSSSDGYCSIITFGERELGEPFRNIVIETPLPTKAPRRVELVTLSSPKSVRKIGNNENEK